MYFAASSGAAKPFAGGGGEAKCLPSNILKKRRCDKQTWTTVQQDLQIAINFDTSITNVYSSHYLTINIWKNKLHL